MLRNAAIGMPTVVVWGRLHSMVSNLDIWRAANLLIRHHGEDAEIVAAQRANLTLERGDRHGQLVWLRIV